jgi:hypothetical protein
MRRTSEGKKFIVSGGEVEEAEQDFGRHLYDFFTRWYRANRGIGREHD